jgi:hypothetical protein
MVIALVNTLAVTKVPLPSVGEIKGCAKKRFHFLVVSVIGDTYDGNLEFEFVSIPRPVKEVITSVFLIRAFNAPTPPLSPEDMPSTSSMINNGRPLIWTPSTLVA